MNIVTVIGNESHTTSRAWAKIKMDGKQLSHADSISKKWLTEYGNKHATWVECVFDVRDGAEIEWEAGSNTGARGANRTRIHQEFIADTHADVLEAQSTGYPDMLKGRLREVTKHIDVHAALLATI